MPLVDMNAHEFTRVEEACKKLGVTTGVTTYVTAVGVRGEPAQAEMGMQFTGDKVVTTVKTETGRLYEISLEVAEK